MVDLHTLCMGCMGNNEGRDVCPHCGYEEAMRPQPEDCLPLRTLLQNRYLVGRLLERNGEGIGYIGYDTVSDGPVYIREFMPYRLCGRNPETGFLQELPGCEVPFKEAKIEFLEHSRNVARLRELPVMVPIYDIFQQNHTAYVISEWTEHITLAEYVERSGGRLEWNAARALFMPVLSGLSDLYQAGVRHLGLSPDNLIITQSGKMKLWGFCVRSVRQTGTQLEPELFRGCAAVEQYSEPNKISQATDVYGFTAVLFYALTGELPQEAVKRRNDGRLLIPTNILKQIPPHIVTALANGLQVEPDRRTQTFERLRAELSAAPTVTMVLNEVAAPPKASPAQRKREALAEQEKRGVPNYVWGLVSCVVAAAVFLTIALIWMNRGGEEVPVSSGQSSAASVSSTSSQEDSSQASAVPGETIDMPNLVGENFEDAQKAAQENGKYQVLMSTEEFNDTVAEGHIISQVPEYAEGEKLPEGSVIAVIVSKGPENRPLPAIAGLSLTEASAQLTANGFVPVKGSETYSSEYPEGRVIGYESFTEGDSLPQGTSIRIIVSKGPDPSASSSNP